MKLKMQCTVTIKGWGRTLSWKKFKVAEKIHFGTKQIVITDNQVTKIILVTVMFWAWGWHPSDGWWFEQRLLWSHKARCGMKPYYMRIFHALKEDNKHKFACLKMNKTSLTIPTPVGDCFLKPMRLQFLVGIINTCTLLVS